MDERDHLEELRALSIRNTLERMQSMECELAELRQQAELDARDLRYAEFQVDTELPEIQREVTAAILNSVPDGVQTIVWVLLSGTAMGPPRSDPTGERKDVEAFALAGAASLDDLAVVVLRRFILLHAEKATGDGHIFCTCGYCYAALRVLRTRHPNGPCGEDQCVLEEQEHVRAADPCLGTHLRWREGICKRCGTKLED